VLLPDVDLDVALGRHLDGLCEGDLADLAGRRRGGGAEHEGECEPLLHEGPPDLARAHSVRCEMTSALSTSRVLPPPRAQASRKPCIAPVRNSSWSSIATSSRMVPRAMPSARACR